MGGMAKGEGMTSALDEVYMAVKIRCKRGGGVYGFPEKDKKSQ